MSCIHTWKKKHIKLLFFSNKEKLIFVKYKNFEKLLSPKENINIANDYTFPSLQLLTKRHTQMEYELITLHWDDETLYFTDVPAK